MTNFLDALKSKLSKANENFRPKSEKEAREMALSMVMGTTSASSAGFKGIVGNKGTLLRAAVKKVGKLKGKNIKVIEGGKEIGKISRRLLGK